MPSIPEDLAPLLSSRQRVPVFRQGEIIAWDTSTRKNTVRILGQDYEDVHIQSGLEGFSLAPGNIVALSWSNSQWYIIGRILEPGDNADLQLIVDTPNGMIVRGGGGIVIEDGGAIEADYADGSTAILYGTLSADADGNVSHGLLVQRNDLGDILRAKQDDSGAYVWVGQSSGSGTNRVDEFGVWADFIFMSSAGQLQLNSGNGQYFYNTLPISGTGTALAVNSVGGIVRNTSSARFKEAIADADVDTDAVLRLRPRSYVRRGGSEREVGFIAEEVEEVGLTEFVGYDAYDRPESVAYDRLTAALVAVAQRQAAQIEDLTAQVKDLTARVAALEGGGE